MTLQGEKLSSQPVLAEHGAGVMAIVGIKVDVALGSIGKERKKTKRASMLLCEPAVHPALLLLVVRVKVWGLEEAQRSGGASLTAAAE